LAKGKARERGGGQAIGRRRGKARGKGEGSRTAAFVARIFISFQGPSSLCLLLPILVLAAGLEGIPSP